MSEAFRSDKRVILSLFDFSGEWSRPYREAGYEVCQVDLQHGQDIMTFDASKLGLVQGVLAAPPCTDFAASGARWWAGKDSRGETDLSIALVTRTMDIIQELNPVWWALENPVGRIQKLCPRIGQPRMSFHPCDFGEPYTKKTMLWGNFNADLKKTPVKPEGHRPGHPNSWYSKVGGKSLKTKNHRSATPRGFASAFFEANP